MDLGDDLEATLRALKAAKRADKKRQREETEPDEMKDTATHHESTTAQPQLAEAPIEPTEPAQSATVQLDAMEQPPIEQLPTMRAVEDLLAASNEFEALSLPIEESASPQIVRSAYKRACLLIHPDKSPHPEANDAFNKLTEAMQLLSNPAQQELRRWQLQQVGGAVGSGANASGGDAMSDAADVDGGVDQAPVDGAAAAEEDGNTEIADGSETEADEEEPAPVPVDETALQWQYEGEHVAFHGEQSALLHATVFDDVFGRCQLRGQAPGKLMVLVESETDYRWRTEGHISAHAPAAASAIDESEQAPNEEPVNAVADAVEAANAVANAMHAKGGKAKAKASNGKAASSKASKRPAPEEEEASSPEEPQLVLYTVSKPKDDKRAVLHVFDAKNDPVNLSSRAVKRVMWAANVPSSILGKEYDGANKACCALRDALDPSKKSLGNNGINFKVFMCLNSEGKAVTVKEVLDKKQLGKYLK